MCTQTPSSLISSISPRGELQDSHAQHPASVATGSGIKRQRGAALPLASGERAALPLASGEHVEQGKEGQAEEKPHEWYHIKSIGDNGKKHKCQCKGNCISGCLARRQGTKKVGCPNPATWNLPGCAGGKIYIRPVPLCQACVCQTPECKSGARRPYGNFAHPCNYGRCRSCWVPKPT